MNLNIQVGKKALLTLDNWFVAPDGSEYKAVFGTVKSIKTAEKTLGIKPNSKSTNWYVEIGNMTIAGCQIHYGIQTDHCHSGEAKNWTFNNESGVKIWQRPCVIYFADVEYKNGEKQN